MSVDLYKWRPSICDHLENIYVPASLQGIEPSTSSLFSISTTNLLTGRSRYLHFWLTLSTDHFCHFCLFLSVNSTSFLHLFQNALDKCCTSLQCFLKYISAGIKTPDGGITTLDFIVSRLIGLSGTGLVTSLITSVVKGRELTIASTSVNKVFKDSSVWLPPLVFNNEMRIFWAVLIC